MNLQIKTITYTGDTHTDDRGQVKFVNDFNFKGIKRFYQIENANTDIIRAFHGHKTEAKYVYVASGTILLCAAYIDNFDNPSKNIIIQKHILSSKKPQVVYIPPHFVNGFKALKPNTKVIFYSTRSLKESEEDDFRIPYDYWGAALWQKF